ncbi:MAG TPA: Trm112 family protein [Thiothrix sp.]|nr:Trm112 family protein [Thiothrix sp.]
MDKKLLAILVCPVTKGPLIYDKQRQELIAKAAGLAYPIEDNIPILLESAARELSHEEIEQLQVQDKGQTR